MKLLAVALLLAAGLSSAGGFAVHDLTQSTFDPAVSLGKEYLARSAADRITMVCTGCEGAPMLDVQLGRQTDGTEERVRTGVTTIGQLEALCRSRDPACRMEMVSVAPAVGWMSTYKLGAQYAHTVVILRDGDRLVIRSLSADQPSARRNVDVLLAKLVPEIVGK